MIKIIRVSLVTIVIKIFLLDNVGSYSTELWPNEEPYPGQNGRSQSVAQAQSMSEDDDHGSFIAFTNENSIETFFILNETQSPFPGIKHPDFLSSLSGLAFDWKRQTYFYSEYDLGTINSASFNGTPSDFKILAKNQKTVYACYFDPVENYLYLTSYYDSAITRINPYGNNSTPEVILKLISNDKVRGIAVDPCDSRIYFANGNFHRPSIQRSSIDGLNLEAIIDTDIKYPRGLTLDHSAKELYWGDRDLNKIEKADFDGKNRVVIVQQEANTDFFGIAVTKLRIYWTDFKPKTVFRTDKINNGTAQVIPVKTGVQPRGIVFVSKQIDSRSNCVVRPNLQNFNKDGNDRKWTFGLGQKNRILQCIFKVGPTTRVKWIHNGHDYTKESTSTKFVNSASDNQSVSVSTFYFKNVRMSDEGNYTCLVSNGFVEEASDFYVKICSTCVPKIDKSKIRRTLTKGPTSQVLSCKYRSTSEANITWTHNGEILSETFPNFDGSTSGESVIRFPQVNEDSAGKYNCSAMNQFGHDYFAFGVEVEEESIKDEVIYALSGFVVLILMLVLLVAFLWKKYKTKNGDTLNKLSEGELKEFFEGNPAIRNLNSNSPRYANEIALALPFDSRHEISLAHLVIDKNTILGQGQFGMVLRGEINGKPVAVKTLKPNADLAYLKALLSEIKIMAYIENHDGIVQFLGVDTSKIHDNIIHVVVELSPMGDLHSYLEKNRSDFIKHTKVTGQMYENVKPIMSQQNFTNWNMQIAGGMKYLEEKKVVHADLATRNILMFHGDVVKISDFGLSRQLYGYTKYVKKSKSPLPFRWMALESLRFMEFTSQTDVWSYGVLTWEIFSLGQVPFPEFNWSENFVKKLARGLRLPQPDYASNEIYAVMIKCWHRDPNERPTFEYLQDFFQERLNKSSKNPEAASTVVTAKRYVNAPSYSSARGGD